MAYLQICKAAYGNTGAWRRADDILREEQGRKHERKEGRGRNDDKGKKKGKRERGQEKGEENDVRKDNQDKCQTQLKAQETQRQENVDDGSREKQVYSPGTNSMNL